MNSVGNGQMQPADAASDFGVMSFIVRQQLARVRTMVVVKVVGVTNEGDLSPVGFVDVVPLVNQIDGDNNATPHGTVFGLPYFRLQGGSNAVIIDPQVDNIGFAIIADRDISAVKTTKAAANPGSGRRFDLADGVYIGGILNGAPTQVVRFSPAGIDITSPTKVSITAPTIVLQGNLQIDGTASGSGGGTVVFGADIHSTGAIVAGFGGGDQVTLQGHKHAGVTTGAGSTASPTAGT